MSGSRMFPFITKTWNPLGGDCLHDCCYCWARMLTRNRKMAKYEGKARLIESIVKRFKPDDFIFVCDMCDLFGNWVNAEDIRIVLGRIAYSPAQFLLLTKNPLRYMDLMNAFGRRTELFGSNTVLGCTIESDRNYPELSKAPSQYARLYWMTNLAKLENETKAHRLFISIEPVLDFNDDSFFNIVGNWIKPWAVAIGYDNYGNKLPEPPLAKTMQLIDRLEKAGITVYRKTLREAWNDCRK